jgi:peptidoglycan/LPS O-acetylase OafA/YrhL
VSAGRLSYRTIVALDAARAVAAFYVVCHHVSASVGFSSKGLGLIFRFGQEAVLLFFLLSGFVIFANEQVRALSPRGYYLRRIRRVYPALLVAMLVSTLVAFDNGDLQSRFSWRELFGTLIGLQDISALKPGVIVDPYLNNDPLWSLSYELAFYAIFPLCLSIWRRWSTITDNAIGAICCALYLWFSFAPNHFTLVGAYFLVWWTGAMVANAYLQGRRSFLQMGVAPWWLLALCAVSFVPIITDGYRGPGYYPALPFRHFAVGLLMVVLLFGSIGRVVANILMPATKIITPMATVSYGLYVLHYPLLVNWQRAHQPVGFLAAMVIAIILVYFVERQLPRLLPAAPKT